MRMKAKSIVIDNVTKKAEARDKARHEKKFGKVA